MNLCRTCKYWALNEHMLGLGICTNCSVNIRVLPSDIRTAQDFGCILHETGFFPSIYSPEESGRILKDGTSFILSTPPQA